jgi:hypothetical protein
MDDKVVTAAQASNPQERNTITPPKDKGMKRHAGGTTVSRGMAGLLRLCIISGRCRYVPALSQGSR